MTVKRYQHACGTFNYNSKKIVIVAGGYEGSLQPTLSTTEILDPSSLESGWVRGTIMSRDPPNVPCSAERSEEGSVIFSEFSVPLFKKEHGRYKGTPIFH